MISPLSLEICIQIASLSLLFSVNNKMLSKVRHDIERMPSWFCQGEHSRAAPPSRPTLLPAPSVCVAHVWALRVWGRARCALLCWFPSFTIMSVRRICTVHSHHVDRPHFTRSAVGGRFLILYFDCCKRSLKCPLVHMCVQLLSHRGFIYLV